ncbi:MAG: AAA family ATPase [Chlamydiales bacterium]|nr:AAA family ATPase [Chlamydiales bacterium]
MEKIDIDEIVERECGTLAGQLMMAAREGHLCLEMDDAEGCIELSGDEERFEGIVGRWGNLVYLQRNWVLEGEVVRGFSKMMRDVKPIDMGEVGRLNPGQAKAVKTCLSEGVVCLTGGPGTGKSFVIGEIVKRFGGKVSVCAPTGKAASILGEKLDCEVGTIHGLLGLRDGKDILFGGREIDAEMVIVDECSMIDVGVWAALFRNLKEGTRLILVGDHEQLPPVEAGTIFGELSAVLKDRERGYAHLDECMRSDRQEVLGLAEAVKLGEMIPYQSLERRVDQWKEEFKRGGFRILSCLRKGPYGVEAINELMWGEGEIPIIITRTDKRIGLSNGEMGILVKKNEGRSLGKDDVARFGEREFPAVLLPEFESAYCLSVHKAQGSEFERVVLLVPKGSEVFGREVLYTGITRAKESVEVLADEGVIEECLKKSATKKSGIRRRLCAH